MRKIIYKLALPVVKFYWFIFRPSTFGVKCIIHDNGKILMVKHTYGKGWWNFPGGGIEKTESKEQAIRREVLEELGIEVENPKLVGNFLNTLEYKKDNVTVFSAEAKSPSLKLQEAEIQEAKWVPVDDLPNPMSRVAKRALDLWLGQR